MKNQTALLIVILTLSLHAQKLLGQSTGEKNTAKQRVLVVPFEPKMYRNSLDREIASREDKSYKEIREEFRSGVALNIDLEAQKATRIVTLNTLDSSEGAKDLEYIYSSIGYKYLPVPSEEKEEEQSTKDKLRSRISQLGRNREEKEETSERGARIRNGEIVTESDNREKYMKAQVINPDLLRYLKDKYQVNKVIFITELDVNYAASEEAYAVGTSETSVKVKIHFTAYDVAGKELGTGAAITFFTDKYKNQAEIIRVHMQGAAKAIVRSAGI